MPVNHSMTFLECQHGSYGLNCQHKCNEKCTGCNNVNGFCDRGCQPGWKGDYCQQRIEIS